MLAQQYFHNLTDPAKLSDSIIRLQGGSLHILCVTVWAFFRCSGCTAYPKDMLTGYLTAIHYPLIRVNAKRIKGGMWGKLLLGSMKIRRWNGMNSWELALAQWDEGPPSNMQWECNSQLRDFSFNDVWKITNANPTSLSAVAIWPMKSLSIAYFYLRFPASAVFFCFWFWF